MQRGFELLRLGLRALVANQRGAPGSRLRQVHRTASGASGSTQGVAELETATEMDAIKEVEGVGKTGKARKTKPPRDSSAEEREGTLALDATEKAPEMPKEFGYKPKGLEPTRYGDWERAGRCSDF